MIDLRKQICRARPCQHLTDFLAQVAGDRDAVTGITVGVMDASHSSNVRHQVKGKTQLAAPRVGDGDAGKLRKDLDHARLHFVRAVGQVERGGELSLIHI